MGDDVAAVLSGTGSDVDDVVGDHRAHLSEHHLAVLTEDEFQRIALADLRGVEEPEVVADVVGVTGGELRAEYVPGRCRPAKGAADGRTGEIGQCSV